MKCINCGTDNNYRDRGLNRGRCRRCNHRFVFDSTAYLKYSKPLTDTFFKNTIGKISVNDTLFFTHQQFFYFLNRSLQGRSFLPRLISFSPLRQSFVQDRLIPFIVLFVLFTFLIRWGLGSFFGYSTAITLISILLSAWGTTYSIVNNADTQKQTAERRRIEVEQQNSRTQRILRPISSRSLQSLLSG